MKCVVDTNVPIVANGTSSKVNIDCQLNAIHFLQKIVQSGLIFLDTDGRIQAEYGRYLSPRGQPGVGDRFYLEIINSDPRRLCRIDVQTDKGGNFEILGDEINNSDFDRNDRIFAAVAKQSGAKVYNATDSDWVDFLDLLIKNGVNVEFICGKDKYKWFDR